MTKIPADLSYTDQHEWVRIDGSQATIGITDYAVTQLGDVVFVELPDVDTVLSAGDVVGEIESTKSVSELFAPIAGTVVKANTALADNPELVNAEPYGEGWIYVTTVGDLPSLLTAEEYEKLVNA